MSMKGITMKSANEAWLETLQNVVDVGHIAQVCCADGEIRSTTEILGETTSCSMSLPVVSYTKRKLSYKFMVAEAAWVLSGSDKMSDIEPFNHHLAKYSDDGLIFFGAYGPRVTSQLDYVVSALTQDQSSRRAVLTIWRQNPPVTKDTPCTLSAQFLIRNGFLHLVVTMRSSDVWLGLPYDIFTFSMIAGSVFLRLKANGVALKGLGNLVNFAGSRHLYQQDLDKIKELQLIEEPGPTDEKTTKLSLFNVHNFEKAEDLEAHLWALAKGEKKDGLLSDVFIPKGEQHG
jgi:thymidylate synthase